MAKNVRPSIDLAASWRDLSGQFQGLDFKKPGQWPLLPQVTAYVAVTAAVVVGAWFGMLSATQDTLTAEREREPGLKAEFRSKLTQAINLEALQKQKAQVEEYVTQLEKQLPGKAEMDALLSDINQAGIGRGLQFELFKPGQVAVKDYYAELPIAIKISGRYHDIGAFAADIAGLSRIVTLHNLQLTVLQASKDPNAGLTLETTARTYRYLDPNEIEQVRQAKAKEKKEAAK